MEVINGAALGATTVNEKFTGPALPAALLTEIARVYAPRVVVVPVNRPDELKENPDGIDDPPDQVKGAVPED